jgi:anaerobic magnesium-protoporphyrin IX monomethyl ester cyclase
MKQGKHRILLIEPPFYRLYKDTYSLDRYPLSLGYLAGTICKETDWEVLVYNADFCSQSESMSVGYLTTKGYDNYLNHLNDLSMPVWHEIQSAILDFKPDVIGISTKSQNFKSVCIVARIAKEINEDITVIVGGPHPTMTGADIFKCADFDVSVVGEGEEVIVELLNAIATRENFNNIRGIIYREGGKTVETAPREYIKDLDSLCFPHESAPEVLKDYDKYPRTAFRNIFTIRGCPYNCLFCGSYKIWSRKSRFRSPESVVREIKQLQEMGLRVVNFDDDTFGVSKKHIDDLCKAIREHCPGLQWSSEIHVKLVDDQTISIMKEAGCYAIQVGVESGNNEILKQMRKGTTVEEALNACDIIHKHGMELKTFFIVGFPMETEETLSDTVAAMKRVKCDLMTYSIFTPFPGTESFELCKEYGLIDDNYDVSLYNLQSPANCFCKNIERERFRMLASKIEKMVDRKNSLSRIKRIFSKNTLYRIQELGILKSVQKGIRVFIRR